MALTRIETAVAKDYWDRWTMTHALKEIIANAKDATVSFPGAKYSVKWVPGQKKLGVVTIEDTGGGFDKRCLMLGAGEDVKAGHIKRFHEGMKGAMVVAARTGRAFDLRTTDFAVPKVAIEDTQLGSDGFVFTTRKPNRTQTPMTLVVAYSGRREAKLYCYENQTAYHYYGCNREGLTKEQTFADFDLTCKAPPVASIPTSLAAGLHDAISDVGGNETTGDDTMVTATARLQKQGPPKAAKVASKGNASKGRSLPTVPASSLRLDRRNPFGYESRIHAYFQAFIHGKGTATIQEMTDSCTNLNAKYGITDIDPAALRHYLNNYTAAWRKGDWSLTVVQDPTDRTRFTCTHVKGVPWTEAVGSKSR